MSKWILEGYDEMGSYFYCSECGCGFALEHDFGDWTPDECPSCKAPMEGVCHGEDD